MVGSFPESVAIIFASDADATPKQPRESSHMNCNQFIGRTGDGVAKGADGWALIRIGPPRKLGSIFVSPVSSIAVK